MNGGDVPNVPVTTLSGLATLTQRKYKPVSPLAIIAVKVQTDTV